MVTLGVFKSPPQGGFLNTYIRDRMEFLRSKNLQCVACHAPSHAVGVSQTSEVDLDQFLSMIRFDTRQKLDTLPSF